MITLVYALLAIVIFFGVLLLAGAIYELSAEAADRKDFPPPGRIVAVGDTRLHLLAMGERSSGQPVVVLESGLGNGVLAWSDLQPRIAAFARVIAYDRGGLGWSGPAGSRRSPERMVAGLHAALEAAGETGPYVFAGHAMGATLSRLYAARYPQDAAALVLLDPSHEQLSTFLPLAAHRLARLANRSRWSAWLARVGLLRLGGGRLWERFAPSTQAETPGLLAHQTLTPRFFRSLAEECAVFLQPESWQGLSSTYDDLLLIVVAPEQPGLSADDATARGRQALVEDLLARSPRSHLMSVASAEDLLSGRPDAVLAAIQTAAEITALRPADAPQAQPPTH
jgi:pimeloyl-ACP methyl ester carboxylesterase